MSVSDLSHDSYDGGPARPSMEPVYTRVYRPRGKVAHLWELIFGCPVVGRLPSPDWFDRTSWLGTGNQEEYEQAAKKPLCRECFRRREAGFTDPRLGAGHGTEMT